MLGWRSRGDGPDLAEESLAHAGVVDDLRADDLEDLVAAHDPVVGEVDDPHAAPAQLADDLVVGDLGERLGLGGRDASGGRNGRRLEGGIDRRRGAREAAQELDGRGRLAGGEAGLQLDTQQLGQQGGPKGRGGAGQVVLGPGPAAGGPLGGEAVADPIDLGGQRQRQSAGVETGIIAHGTGPRARPAHTPRHQRRLLSLRAGAGGRRLPVSRPAPPGGPVGGEGSPGPPDPPAHEGASPSQVRRIRSSLRTTERRPRPIRPAISSLL